VLDRTDLASFRYVAAVADEASAADELPAHLARLGANVVITRRLIPHPLAQETR
jgi:hypothetical protein